MSGWILTQPDHYCAKPEVQLDQSCSYLCECGLLWEKYRHSGWSCKSEVRRFDLMYFLTKMGIEPQ